MEPMVHTRPESESNEFAFPMPLDESLISEQLAHAIRKALCLNDPVRMYEAERSNNRVTWACDSAGIRIDAARSITKFTNKAVADANKVSGLGFLESQVVEQTPYSDGDPGQGAASDSTKPTGQECHVTPGNSIC